MDSTPAAHAGNIYFGCSNGSVYCVDAGSLEQSSVKDLGSEVVSSPATSGPTDVLLTASLNGKVFALDASDLTNELWSYDIRTQDNKPNVKIRSSPAVVSGQVFVVAGDSNYRYLYCFGN